MTSLAANLLGTTRSAVLSALLLHTERALHVREIARITGASPGSLHRELRALTALGLLLRQETGRQVHYRANTTSPVYDDIAGLLRKTSGVADVLRDALTPLTTQLDAAFVYGSVAKGAESTRSDIDVMIVGSLSFATAVAALAPTQTVLRRDVNVMIISPRDWAKKLRNKDPFLLDVARNKKLWLMGEGHDFAKPAQNRKA